MTTLRSAAPLVLRAPALAVGCASSGNQPPEGTQTQPRTGGRGRFPGDSARFGGVNKVIENSRPDAPARAGVIVVANQQGASATVVDAATMKTIATLPVGNGPHEAAISPDGRWAAVTLYRDHTRWNPGLGGKQQRQDRDHHRHRARRERRNTHWIRHPVSHRHLAHRAGRGGERS